MVIKLPKNNKFKSESQRISFYSGRHNAPKVEEPKTKSKKPKPQKREGKEDKKLKYLKRKIERQEEKEKAIQKQSAHVRRESAILQRLYANKLKPENVEDVREGGSIKGTSRLDPRFGGGDNQ